MLQTLVAHAEMLNSEGLSGEETSALFVNGSLGFGKSHLLAALCCFLIRRGKTVIYIPDCHALVVNFLDYFRQALILTFVNDEERLEKVFVAPNIQDLMKLCTTGKDALYIIVDQMNCLDKATTNDHLLGERKQRASELIADLTFRNFFIYSASGNYKIELDSRLKQRDTMPLNCFGGLTKVF